MNDIESFALDRSLFMNKTKTWLTTHMNRPTATITKILSVMKTHDRKVNRTTQIHSNFNKLKTLDNESFFQRT